MIRNNMMNGFPGQGEGAFRMNGRFGGGNDCGGNGFGCEDGGMAAAGGCCHSYHGYHTRPSLS